MRRHFLTYSTDISIHAPREGGDVSSYVLLIPSDFISIHAPREGGDPDGKGGMYDADISIHAPREGGDARQVD